MKNLFLGYHLEYTELYILKPELGLKSSDLQLSVGEKFFVLLAKIVLFRFDLLHPGIRFEFDIYRTDGTHLYVLMRGRGRGSGRCLWRFDKCRL